MSTIKDPAVTGWRAWKRAESRAAQVPVSSWAAAYAATEEADERLFVTWPTTSLGAWCLLARAYLARLISERNASEAPIDDA